MKNTLKLAGLLIIALIVVLSCTPKQNGTAMQKQSISEVTATEETTTGDDFFFGIETGNGPEYPQFVVDSGGGYFTFHRIKPLKDIRLISIGITFEGKLYEDNVYAYELDETGFYTNIGFYDESKRYEGNVFTSVPNEIKSFFVMVSVSEGIPTRGIAFTDENGNRKYFFISKSGMDGSVRLNEFQNANEATAALSDFQMDGTTLVKYTGYARNVIIPNGITVIGDDVFREYKLTSIIIPNGVTQIGKGAFFNSELTSVIIPNSVTSIDDYAFSGNRLIDINIPDSVTYIGYHAFIFNNLTSIYIPDSVTYIGDFAFAGNELEMVNIGDNSEAKIGVQAFDNEYRISLR